jgi:hypothetical protein
LQDDGLQGSTFTYIKYIYSVSSWEHQAGSNVVADWLHIDSRKQIAAVWNIQKSNRIMRIPNLENIAQTQQQGWSYSFTIRGLHAR